ncbi:DUF5908 family protein [Azospirillum thermophilum]|uniref:Uncharacterized protein n=1 Tax=Azospirillum thermophilum TaxID=2202148 RepID=A0A2S2CZF3_9PROT|nr:DUF5908 family protein [Azospirillum thermophilum]AWK89881.1 hypothetical protein DEW08_28075 [Azospirillum thermophilum]
MSLEISEIGVRIVVQDVSGGVSGTGAGAPPGALAPAEKAQIVDLCVREVLRTLQMNEAR